MIELIMGRFDDLLTFLYIVFGGVLIGFILIIWLALWIYKHFR